MLTLPRTSLALPARLRLPEASRAPTIWKEFPATIELTRSVEVFRIDARRLGVPGEWYALGTWVASGGAPSAASAQRPLAYTDNVTLEPGTVLNVGVCDPSMGDEATVLHAELLRGPVSRTRPLDGWWQSESPR